MFDTIKYLSSLFTTKILLAVGLVKFVSVVCVESMHIVKKSMFREINFG